MFVAHLGAATVAWLALCALAPSPAAAAPPRPLSLEAYLDEVRARAPRLAAIRAHAAAARAGVARHAVRPNPRLTATHEAAPGLDQRDVGLTLAVPLDVAGRRGLGTQAAREEADAEQADADAAEAEALREAARAYGAAAVARARLEALAAERADLAALAAAQATRVAAGDLARHDGDRLALELALLDDELAGERAAADAAARALGGRLGDVDAPVIASDAPALPAAPAMAPARHLLAAAATARARAATTTARVARRGWIPALELGLGVVLAHEDGDDAVGYAITLGGELPVWDRGAAAARHADAAAAAWTAEAAARTDTADAAVIDAQATLVAAIARAQAFADGPAALAVALAATTRVAYLEGERGVVDLVDAHRTRRDATLRALALVHAASDAALDLAAAREVAP